MRKYLDDIGITDRPDTWVRNDKRRRKWEQERRIYGFDERETWNLNYSFYLWLYERLKRFLEVACIDLDWHEFEYNGKKYTQRVLIKMTLERLEFFFNSEYNYLDEKQNQYVSEIEKIWAVVLPAMWW